MDYITAPSVQEMFFYFVVMVGIITLLAVAILSPLIVGDLFRILRK
jgi:hypothetical protein